MGLRKKDFKIGVWHSKWLKNEKEDKIRNHLFVKGMVNLILGRREKKKIRLIAYELPLKYPSKGKSIDLLGIDRHWCPYIFELKDEDNPQELQEVIDQINKYQRNFEKMRKDVEKEVRNMYFIPRFKFVGETQKIILAPPTLL
ncbi:hypothetical protein ES706_05219 [subsurface metagenome]